MKQIQKRHDFPEDVARNPAWYGPGKTPLACTICLEKADMKECKECRTQKPLHAFPEDVARNPSRYGPGKTQLLCNSRRAQSSSPRPKRRFADAEVTKECIVGSTSQSLSSFPEDVARNPARCQPGGRKLACKTCAGKGYSAKDMDPYCCQNCGSLGHLKFDADDLKMPTGERKKANVLCVDCKKTQGTCDVDICRKLKKEIVSTNTCLPMLENMAVVWFV